MSSELDLSYDFIKERLNFAPQIGIVLGSGLGDFVKKIENANHLNYEDIPGFQRCSVQGHSGRLYFGQLGQKNIMVMQGRIHSYEGHSLEQVVHPVRTMVKLGAKQIILTNAAGGINQEYSQGQLVNITDHINLTGQNVLVGANDQSLGPRFPDMSYTYCPEMQKYFLECAKELNIELKQGIYAGVLGPSYETPAEVRMLKTLGADLVGMSTVQEAIAAHHMGAKIIGLSCVTNMAAGIVPGKLNHDDIKEVANRVMSDFTKLLHHSIVKMV